jgi:hypothetical protein
MLVLMKEESSAQSAKVSDESGRAGKPGNEPKVAPSRPPAFIPRARLRRFDDLW